MLSPVSIDSSTEVLPSITSPSTGILSPGFTTSMSPTSTSLNRDFHLLAVHDHGCCFRRKSHQLLIASDVFPFDTDSRYLPKRINVIITPMDSKYNSWAYSTPPFKHPVNRIQAINKRSARTYCDQRIHVWFQTLQALKNLQYKTYSLQPLQV